MKKVNNITVVKNFHQGKVYEMEYSFIPPKTFTDISCRGSEY